MATSETIDAFAPPVSRFTALDSLPITTDDDARWLIAGGFQFRPEGCAVNNGGTLAVDCFGKTSAMSTHAVSAVQDGTGFLVYARDDCSTFGYEASDYEGRARRLLASVESYHFANELTLGTATGPASGLAQPNTPLVDSSATVVTAAASTPVNALACLENKLATTTKNRRGFIFMRPQAQVLLASAFAIQLQGNQWLTPMGNIVVADGGITGANPSGAALTGSNQFMYATSWMQVRRGAVSIFGGPNAMGIDRSVNTVTTWAVRPYMWQWDGCLLAAAEVNVGVCG